MLYEKVDTQSVVLEALVEVWGEKPFETNHVKLENVFSLRTCTKFIEIPEDFFNEIENFALNYAFICGGINDKEAKICLKCLKTYTLKEAKKENLHDIVLKFLALQFKGGKNHAAFCPGNKLC